MEFNYLEQQEQLFNKQEKINDLDETNRAFLRLILELGNDIKNDIKYEGKKKSIYKYITDYFIGSRCIYHFIYKR